MQGLIRTGPFSFNPSKKDVFNFFLFYSLSILALIFFSKKCFTKISQYIFKKLIFKCFLRFENWFLAWAIEGNTAQQYPSSSSCYQRYSNWSVLQTLNVTVHGGGHHILLTSSVTTLQSFTTVWQSKHVNLK